MQDTTLSLSPSFVVGVGASAGGLEALERLFRAMPASSGVAFVVVQHLSPDFKSLMDELLARFTTMKIQRVNEPTPLQKNTVYLLPPKKEILVEGETLFVQDKSTEQQLHLPINTFFRSLAKSFKERAIAIILSGTGSDGTLGAAAIHEEGGVVFAQDETSAKFPGMPKSVIDSGVVDVVLPPEEIPSILGRYIQNPTRQELNPLIAHGVEPTGLQSIYERLRQAYDLDFNVYKQATILRRIERRLTLSRCANLQEYSELALSSSAELDALYKDLLIGVTRFFRDTDAFDALKEKIIPQVIASVLPEDEIRVWIPGCASGEEPYSIAILFLEELARLGRKPLIKIFATDMHRDSLMRAAEGLFNAEILQEIPFDLRSKYFIEEASGRYRVTALLRKTILFSPHNVLSDPPFTKIDLVSCRNMLIYFQPSAQNKALGSFYFALRHLGYLFLGPSEGLGELTEQFEVIDRQWKMFRKTTDARLASGLRVAPNIPLQARTRISFSGDLRVARAYESLLARFVPMGVLIGEHREVLHFFGEAERFFHPAPGRASNDLVLMARGDLRVALSSAIQSCQKRLEKVSLKSVHIRDNRESDTIITVSVEPLLDRITNANLMLVLLSDEKVVRLSEARTSEEGDFSLDSESKIQLQQLEQQLQHTKESLQTTVEELETSNEELQASNEELLASNEELQSTNEELHSVNEELYSVNAEYEQKIKELNEATSDLRNLMQASEIGTVFTDQNLRIRLFTQPTTEIFNLLLQDIGRDIRHITSRIKDDNIFEEIARVNKDQQTREERVKTPEGRIFLRRIKPYTDQNKEIVGLILTFVDVTSLHKIEEQARESERLLRDAIEQTPIGILTLDPTGNILLANPASKALFGYKPDEEFTQDFKDLFFTENLKHISDKQPPTRVEYETSARRRDGQQVPFAITLTSLQRARGSLLFAFLSDLSIRREQQQIKETTRAVLDSSASSIAVINKSGEIIMTNHAWNKSLEESDHPSSNGFLHANYLDVCRRANDQYAKRALKVLEGVLSGEQLSGDLDYPCPTQHEQRWFWMHVAQLPVGDGGAVIMHTNITDRIHNQEKLQHLNTELKDTISGLKSEQDKNEKIERKLIEAAKLESLGVLVGGIAHDFNNILTGVLGNASIAAESVPPGSELQQVISDIEQASLRASDLCRQMLAYAGRTPFVIAPVDFWSLLKDTAKLVKSSISKQTSLQYEIAHDLPLVESDAVQIQQVLMNLIINAAEAIGEREGEIKIRLFPLQIDNEFLRQNELTHPLTPGEYLCCEIQDTGDGIKPEDIKRIFEPFFTTKFTGRGLGLASAYGIIGKHRGAMKITSTLGVGTCFQLFLPANRQPTATPTPTPAPIKLSTPGKILIIDDEEQVSRTLKRILERLGMSCASASDGPSGCALFAKDPTGFSLILLDVAMPGWDGSRTFEEIRKLSPNIPVLIMSGYSEPDTANKLKQKISGFIQKPFSAASISQAIQAAIKGTAPNNH